MKTLFWFFCVASVANGLWMLVAPYSWYMDLPASVPDTGPFNPHFVRDIGVTFVVLLAPRFTSSGESSARPLERSRSPYCACSSPGAGS
jgi:hypothetical protein